MPEKIPQSPKPAPQVQINFTGSPKLLAAIKEFAKWHGDRPVRRELELAAECHVTRSILNALEWEPFIDALKKQKPDLDPTLYRAELEGRLEELERQAFEIPDSIIELLP
jgi:hypothetical protein